MSVPVPYDAWPHQLRLQKDVDAYLHAQLCRSCTCAHGSDDEAHFSCVCEYRELLRALATPPQKSLLRIQRALVEARSSNSHTAQLHSGRPDSSGLSCLSSSSDAEARALADDVPAQVDDLVRASEIDRLRSQLQHPDFEPESPIQWHVGPHNQLPHCIAVRGEPFMLPAARGAVAAAMPPPIEDGAYHPDSGAVVIVSLGCGMAVLRGAHVYVPGVLAMQGVRSRRCNDCSLSNGIGSQKTEESASSLSPVCDRRCYEARVSVYVDLEGKCRRGLSKSYTGETAFLGRGVCVVTRNDVFGPNCVTKGVAVYMTDPVFAIPSLGHLEPRLTLQNESSCFAAVALDPKPGMNVLDMCAAPGGKTTYIAQLMHDHGSLKALERSAKRAAGLEAYIKETGLTCVEVIKMDAAKAAKRFEHASFDRVLLDAPCSGLGQRPRLVNDTPLHEIQGFASYQRRLIQTAVQLVKPGGILVYSTCSINPAENEENVAWLLEEHPDLKLEQQDHTGGGPGLAGFGLTQEQCGLVRRFDPRYHDTIGFFIARFRRTLSSPENK